ncbi:ThiJ/PfpI family protein [Acaromyces ingoldii]|uniref:D-lactate dehydratase n=1 Tax=Acaromyces ingoldii TaxID=215250 RepID=A0A316YHY5_9BASI|nr:ThiJ/PfpI family protein [Acaromyces ingoldii]PWN88781.1 ThiJ/PfpI family protein [Acaromyces ingoldii]
MSATSDPQPAEGTGTARPKRILHVVSNVAHYADPSHPTGLWISELTHAYDVFAAKGYEQKLVSPKGGTTPLEPRSLKWPLADGSTKAWLADKDRSALLSSTARPDEINAADFDAIYFTGGHAVMWDFPDNEALQKLTREIWEHGGVVSSVCHGYCGLLNTRLADGELLVKGRRVTGYSWREEVLAGVAKQVPYNSEEEMKKRGALYERAFLPFTVKVVADGRLVTGQNPQSAKATAERVASLLSAEQVSSNL